MSSKILNDLLLNSAEKYLTLQSKDGSFKPGHNGPWNDPETPVRNTAHIALILHKAYKISKNKELLCASKKACDFLLLDKNRPEGGNFYSRKTSDPVNGSIGPAWAIEPLIFIGKDLGEDKYLELAEEITEKHKFNKERALWKVLNLDGSSGEIDETFNHQLWFAVMVLNIGNIRKNKKLVSRASDFFSNLETNLSFIEPGLIDHIFRKKGVKSSIKRLAVKGIETLRGNSNFIYERSRGYLSFNTYAFALAYKYNKKMDFWNNSFFKNSIISSITYLIENYSLNLNKNPDSYSWSFNPTGIETAFSVQEFSDYLNLSNPEKEAEKWLSDQIKNYFDFNTGLMEKNTIDPKVLSARFYEAVRLKNYSLDI